MKIKPEIVALHPLHLTLETDGHIVDIRTSEIESFEFKVDEEVHRGSPSFTENFLILHMKSGKYWTLVENAENDPDLNDLAGQLANQMEAGSPQALAEYQRASAAMAAQVLASGLDMGLATSYTCDEAEVMAEFLSQWIAPSKGEQFLHHHSLTDDDPDDNHHEEYLNANQT